MLDFKLHKMSKSKREMRTKVENEKLILLFCYFSKLQFYYSDNTMFDKFGWLSLFETCQVNLNDKSRTNVKRKKIETKFYTMIRD